ncbi:hypothetical protein BH09BAC4_BH09BAC4_07380 [soil metagenome]
MPLERLFFSIGLLIGCLISSHLSGAAINLPFKHLTNTDGLPNMTVLCFTQDRYGFIWIGTENGLCRFDGRSVNAYHHVRDSENSLPHNRVAALYTDAAGKIWVGTAQGLALFDYPTQTFRSFPLPDGTDITCIIEATPGVLWLATPRGIRFFDRKQKRYTTAVLGEQLLYPLTHQWINQIKMDKNGLIYVATVEGLLVIDPRKQTSRLYHHQLNNALTLSQGSVTALVPDDAGHVWLGIYDNYRGHLERLDLQTGYVERVAIPQFAGSENASTLINDLLIDQQSRLWVATSQFSLIRVDPVSRVAWQYKPDLFIPSSLRGQNLKTLFQDKEKQIWVGTELAGANWFNPNRALFTTFGETQDPQTSLPNQWARAAVEDQAGNLWLGTGKGLVVYQAGRGFIRRYTPRDLYLPNYSIRSLARDSSGIIWIGTGSGLNRVLPRTNRMDLCPEFEAGDPSFYWALLVTRRGEVFAGTSGGLRRYNTRQNRLELLTTDALYKPYARWTVRSLAQAADGGLWIGFLRNGLLYWHPERNVIRYYKHVPGDSASLVDDYVTSIATDSFGRVWIATLNGLCAFNPKSQTFRSYDSLFKTNRFGSLLVDPGNRLWLGTSVGLFCLGADRRTVYRFDEGDGLPANEVNDQAAYQLRDGRLCFATQRGFALFRPDALLATSRSPAPVCYLTNFSVYNQPTPLPQHPEAVHQITLKPEQNFFSLAWTALHYDNPQKCLFAYRLVGLDRGWVYSKTPLAQYTNVPGGQYQFEFKASLTPDRWDGRVQRIEIDVDTVFYKRWWFIGLVLLTVAGVIVGVYQYRMHQTVRIAGLQTKAARLQKDNALVQYQNLINQLNPHFLFNSLAVLNGLIREDAQLATRYLSRLTKVYRYLIENDSVELVSLTKEIQFTADFITLLKTRYGTGFQAEIRIPESAGSTKIVPVTLQNLIENAIKHNTTDDEFPLCLQLYVENDYLVVENNLQKRRIVKNSNQKGLNDLKTLYGYLTDRPFGVAERDGKFVVRIPLLAAGE